MTSTLESKFAKYGVTKSRNCPNCGAPYDIHLNKCPYCSTSYFDMSALDFNSEEPFYLKFRAGDIVVTQLVKPCVNGVSMDVTREEVYLDDYGKSTLRFFTGYDVKTNISFEALADPEGHMFEIYKEV